MKKMIVRADIPDDVEERRSFVTNGLESGFTDFILRKGDDFSRIGLMDCILFDDGEPCDDNIGLFPVDSPDDQRRAMSFSGRMAIVRTGDWSVIPLENMIAAFRGKGTELFAIATTPKEAELFLTTMENGVDGVVIQVDDPLDLMRFKNIASEESDVVLSEAIVKTIKPIGMGDRVCIDTCTIMNPGEGMLIGSGSNCLFLIQSESEENGYVATRPFRVNAGAVHSYMDVPGGGTRYLSEMEGGDPVLICDRNGRTRVASIGRCKVEVRPLLMVTAEADGREHSIMVQNAETIRFVTPEGSESVTSLKAGDVVLARTSKGGRHFGIPIEETISEK